MRLTLPPPGLVWSIIAHERFLRRAARLAGLIGELNGHDDVVTLENFTKLTELYLVVETGQMLGRRAVGLIPGRSGLAR